MRGCGAVAGSCCGAAGAQDQQGCPTHLPNTPAHPLRPSRMQKAGRAGGTLPLQPRGLGQSPAAPFGEVLGSPSARRQALLTHSLAANELLLFLKEGIWD